MSSGTSTPRTASTTPTPPDVSPLTVGTQFVKKYYQVLSTAPEDIDRFYKASTSTVTRGHGSDPAVLVATDFTDGAAAARFANHEAIRFEFEHGAIDAQFSVNSGIVLVVTGQVVYVQSEIRKSFVHTFFLGSTVAGVKRSYYVHNDILRFLEMEVTNGIKSKETASAISGTGETEAVNTATQTDFVAAVESVEVNQETKDQPLPVDELTSSVEITPVIKDLALPEEKFAPVTSAPIETKEVPMDDAPGHGVEESKEALLEDDDMTTTASSSKKVSAPATPGSWASLVARTAPGSTPPATPLRTEKTTTPVHGGASVLPSHPSSAVAVKKVADAPAPSAAAASSANTTAPASVPSADHNNHANNRTQPAFRPRREAECTLIIKNIDDSVTEDEIQALFEPFAADTTAGYVGCTVHGHRGIAFVDYDTPEPVVKAVQHQTESGPFMIRELKLDVYQKIFVDKGQPHQRGMGGRSSYRGGAGGRYPGGGGGREYYHPSSGRGGDGGRAAGRSFRRGGGREGRAGGRSSQPSDTASGDIGGGP
jgi:Nuclear transport factor 2 (NTF2) domain/RNA recognition motif. (a.k.a. RRM, RBD, or RNP domain)